MRKVIKTYFFFILIAFFLSPLTALNNSDWSLTALYDGDRSLTALYSDSDSTYQESHGGSLYGGYYKFEAEISLSGPECTCSDQGYTVDYSWGYEDHSNGDLVTTSLTAVVTGSVESSATSNSGSGSASMSCWDSVGITVIWTWTVLYKTIDCPGGMCSWGSTTITIDLHVGCTLPSGECDPPPPPPPEPGLEAVLLIGFLVMISALFIYRLRSRIQLVFTPL